MTQVLTAKPLTEAMSADLTKRIERLRVLGITPTLAIVRVGSSFDAVSYERSSVKRAETLGIAVRSFVLDETASQEKVLLQVRRINADFGIHGCLILHPFPDGMDDKLIHDELALAKDVDGASTASLGAVFTDAPQGFAPATAESCLRMLEFYNIPVEGKHVVVVGRSLVVGKPLAMLMLRKNASVTICHSHTKDLREIMNTADIIVCATGHADAYDASYFKPNQIVMDVGINFSADGTPVGDVDYDSVASVVSAITPVPGGIGSVTTAIMMEHTVIAAEKTVR